MAAIHPDELFNGVAAAIVAIVPYDHVSDDDLFTRVHQSGLSGLATITRDRVFCHVPNGGPLRTPGRSCARADFSTVIAGRWHDSAESNARMLRDTTIVQQTLREYATTIGAELTINGPSYDFGQLLEQGAVVVRWDCAWNFKPKDYEEA